MSQKKAYSFRSSATMEQYMERYMAERAIDRTSLIKLSVYALSCMLARKEVKKMNLHQLVKEVEKLGPDGFPPFADFCDK